jgi:hypothetical protein
LGCERSLFQWTLAYRFRAREFDFVVQIFFNVERISASVRSQGFLQGSMEESAMAKFVWLKHLSINLTIRPPI